MEQIENNRYKIWLVSIMLSCVGLGFALGLLVSNSLDDCPECPQVPNEIRKERELKRKIIKNETIKKVNYIDSARVEQLDSIWSNYATRYGKN